MWMICYTLNYCLYLYDPNDGSQFSPPGASGTTSLRYFYINYFYGVRAKWPGGAKSPRKVGQGRARNKSDTNTGEQQEQLSLFLSPAGAEGKVYLFRDIIAKLHKYALGSCYIDTANNLQIWRTAEKLPDTQTIKQRKNKMRRSSTVDVLETLSNISHNRSSMFIWQ